MYLEPDIFTLCSKTYKEISGALGIHFILKNAYYKVLNKPQLQS